jgi:hypothetical protein
MIDYEHYRRRAWHKRKDSRLAFVLLPAFWLVAMYIGCLFIQRF